MRGRLHPANLALVAVLGIAGVAAIAAPADAQIAAALGKPLASPDLPVGTVSVRIVAGSASAPVTGTDVTLVVNGAPRVARTDSAGRATFPGLAVGATVVAKVLDEDKAEHASEQFAIPDAGGMRVLITTKDWQGGGGAPFAGGAAGGAMPNPRQLSGEARPQQGDPPGMITVRVAYDDFKDTPEGVTVALVGYSADDTTSYKQAKTDKAGRVQFADLDRSGGTSYFLMTLLPRNGGWDRVMTLPLVLEAQTGIRLVLSGEKRDSKAPAVDNLGKNDTQVATAAGKVRVALEGAADASAEVRLVDAATRKVIGQAKPEAAPANPSRVRGGSQFVPDPALPAGTMDVMIIGGAGQADDPIGGVELSVIPAGSSDQSTGFKAVTAADGTVRMALQVTGQQKAVFNINGRPLVSQPFDLGKSGGKLLIRAHWDDAGRLQALFDAAQPAGQVVYVEATQKGQSYRSMPFQLLDGTGSKISVYVYPRTMFRFQLQASVEDLLLAVQGRFDVLNSSWAPYRAGPDGILVAMPHGFKGGVVFGADQAEVSVSAGEGFRIVRPIPPGGRQFHAGFSLPVDAGKVDWSFDLPLGAYQSELDIRKTPGMKVNAPASVTSETRTVPQGTYEVMGPINILPRQSMVMTIEGMPSQPAWRLWVPRVLGVVVVLVIIAGVVLALMRKPVRVVAGADARRQRLMNELVELERSGASPGRREQLLVELEQLWD